MCHRTCAHVRVYVRVYACEFVIVRACVFARVRVCVRVRVRARMRAFGDSQI